MDEKTELTHLQILCLLLSGALSPQDVPLEAWPVLVSEAMEHDVGPFLLWTITRNHTRIVDELHEELSKAYRLAVTRSLILHKAQQTIAQALDRAELPHIWLKGIVLGATVYPDPALRPMVDIDVLVRPDHLPAALRCLHDSGFHTDTYTSLFEPAALIQQGSIHHHVLRGGPAQGVVVELHYNLLVPRSHNILSLEQEQWFHTQTTTYTYGNDRFASLSDETHLLYLCAHMVVQHGLENFALTRSLDLHLLITARALDWQAMLAKAIDLRWSYVVERALQQVQDLFPTRIPPGVLEELRAHRPSDDAVRRVDAMGQPGALFEGYKQGVTRLPWRDQVAWICRVAAPGPGYMRLRYEVPAHHSVLPYYPRRWRHQLGEVIKWAKTQRRLRKRT